MAETKQERFEGYVKWFNPRKGFGFISQSDETKEDLFVHHSEIVSKGYATLHEGDFVDFSICEDTKGRVMAFEVVFRGRKVQPGPGLCYTCGQVGHFARDCTDLRAKLSNNGDNNIDNTKSGACYTCGVVGHFARDCTELRAKLSNNGDNNNSNKSGECYTCGAVGHFARDCTDVRVKSNGGNNYGQIVKRSEECYNCGLVGHFSRDCKEQRKVVNGDNNGEYERKRRDVCFHCGKPGHFARDCRAALKN